MVKTTDKKTRKKTTTRKPRTVPLATRPTAPVMRTVTVNFAGSPGQPYAYQTYDETIQKDDFVIVISPYDGHRGQSKTSPLYSKEANGFPVVVRVVSVVETVESVLRATKWIIGKVDLETAILEEQQRQQKALLDAKIARATKDALESIQLERLRSLSPELDALITERQKLGV